MLRAIGTMVMDPQKEEEVVAESPITMSSSSSQGANAS